MPVLKNALRLSYWKDLCAAAIVVASVKGLLFVAEHLLDK